VIRGSATERRGLERITTDDFNFSFYDCCAAGDIDRGGDGFAGSA
jgi:hypothetical protein